MSITFLNFQGFTHAGLFVVFMQGLLLNIASLYFFGKTRITLMLLFKSVCGMVFGLEMMVLFYINKTTDHELFFMRTFREIPYMLSLLGLSLYPYFRFYTVMPKRLRQFGFIGYPLFFVCMFTFYGFYYSGYPIEQSFLFLIIGSIYPTIVTNYNTYKVIRTIASNPLGKKDKKQQNIKQVSNTIFVCAGLGQTMFISLNLIPVENLFVTSLVANSLVCFLFDLSQLLLQINRKIESSAIMAVKTVEF